MDWIGLAQETDSWRTLVSAVMNLRVPWNEGNSLTSCKPVSISWRTLHHGVSNSWECSSVLGKRNINAWEFHYAAGFSVFLFFPVLSAGWCQSMCVMSLSVALRCAVCVCSRFRHCIYCRLLLYCWLGHLVCCVKLVHSLYWDCSLQGTCIVNWSSIVYCNSSTVSLLCYLLYVRTGLFLLCGGVFCTAVYCTVCLILLVGKRFPVVLSWEWSLSVWWLVGVLVGDGWLGLFCGYWSFRETSVSLLGLC